MKAAPQIEFVSPDRITIKRDERQRKEINIGSLIPSIRSKGILHPILVEDDYTLVAGERRLATAIFLAFEEVPVRKMGDLTELEAQIVELEENFRREDLTWQEQAQAMLRIHQLYVAQHDEDWTTEQTADMAGFSRKHLDKMIDLGEAIMEGDKSVIEADTIGNAATILARRRQRQTGEALNRIMEIERDEPAGTIQVDLGGLGLSSDGSGSSANGDLNSSQDAGGGSSAGTSSLRSDNLAQPVRSVEPPYAIIHADMHQFLATYEGPKFNFLHCDLPYGVELNEQAGQAGFEGGGYESNPDIYWAMCRSLRDNWGKFMFPSAHVMFWISMKFYTETVHFFESAAGIELPASLRINPTPVIWHKTDNKGIIADAKRSPRNIYEAALVMSTEDRFLVKPVSNVYGAPTAKSDSIHTNEKPEPMLRHFLSMYVDGHSRVFDPTCGSGSSIRTAESLGAEAALGLEFNPDFAQRAQSKLIQARNLRNLSGVISAAESEPS